MPDKRHRCSATSAPLWRWHAGALVLAALSAISSGARAQGLPCASTTGLVEAAASKIASEGALQTGGAADFLISRSTWRG